MKLNSGRGFHSISYMLRNNRYFYFENGAHTKHIILTLRQMSNIFQCYVDDGGNPYGDEIC